LSKPARLRSAAQAVRRPACISRVATLESAVGRTYAGAVSSQQNPLVFKFGKSGSDGHRGMKELLGGKGANLAEMSSIGLPVPPGFTITTTCCAYYKARRASCPDGLMNEVEAEHGHVEKP
jgi:hypothetical protein